MEAGLQTAEVLCPPSPSYHGIRNIYTNFGIKSNPFGFQHESSFYSLKCSSVKPDLLMDCLVFFNTSDNNCN